MAIGRENRAAFHSLGAGLGCDIRGLKTPHVSAFRLTAADSAFGGKGTIDRICHRHRGEFATRHAAPPSHRWPAGIPRAGA